MQAGWRAGRSSTRGCEQHCGCPTKLSTAQTHGCTAVLEAHRRAEECLLQHGKGRGRREETPLVSAALRLPGRFGPRVFFSCNEQTLRRSVLERLPARQRRQLRFRGCRGKQVFQAAPHCPAAPCAVRRAGTRGSGTRCLPLLLQGLSPPPGRVGCQLCVHTAEWGGPKPLQN